MTFRLQCTSSWLCRPYMRNLQPFGAIPEAEPWAQDGVHGLGVLETYQEQSLGHRAWPQAKGLPCGRHSGRMRTLLKLLEQGDHPLGHCCQAGTPPGAVEGVHSLCHKVALQLLHSQARLQGSERACHAGAHRLQSRSE